MSTTNTSANRINGTIDTASKVGTNGTSAAPENQKKNTSENKSSKNPNKRKKENKRSAPKVKKGKGFKYNPSLSVYEQAPGEEKSSFSFPDGTKFSLTTESALSPTKWGNELMEILEETSEEEYKISPPKNLISTEKNGMKRKGSKTVNGAFLSAVYEALPIVAEEMSAGAQMGE